MTKQQVVSLPPAGAVDGSKQAEQLAYIRRLVDDAPALSDDQLIRIGRLLEAIPYAA